MAGIRRYGEIGLRLAIGESKGHVYGTLLVESVFIGIVGSVIGTAIGLTASYYLQNVGLDFSEFFKGASVLMSSVMRAKVSATSYFIGFVPGVAATLIGTAIAGIGIYKRQTSQLFKELEV
jgi:putative ABC transport system permease protein